MANSSKHFRRSLSLTGRFRMEETEILVWIGWNMRTGAGAPAWAPCWLILRSPAVPPECWLHPGMQPVQASLPAKRLQRNRKRWSLPAALDQKWGHFSQKFPASLLIVLWSKSSTHPFLIIHLQARGAPCPIKPWLSQWVAWGHRPEPKHFSSEGERADDQNVCITPHTFSRFFFPY